MASTDLELDAPGTLTRPGPVGRVVRIGFGLICLWYVGGLIEVAASVTIGDGDIREVIWNGIVVGLFLISYVINIGYSRAWKKWPAVASAAVFAMIAGFAYLTEGVFQTQTLARAIWSWEIYWFSHLGIAFLVVGVIGTPGCEMRAFHDLFSRLTGIPTQEHICPVGPLKPIDQWEARQSWR